MEGYGGAFFSSLFLMVVITASASQSSSKVRVCPCSLCSGQGLAFFLSDRTLGIVFSLGPKLN